MKLLHHLDARLRAYPRAHRWLRRGSVVLAIGYFLGLVGAILVLRFGGERHWVTTILLYLPRAGFGLPLPAVALSLLLFGPRRLLWGTPVVLTLLLWPLMGLQLGLGRIVAGADRADGRRPLRVMSYNIAAGWDHDKLAAAIRAAAPDILLIQEYHSGVEQSLQGLDVLAGFYRHSDGQFAIASRYPLGEVYLPDKLDMLDSVPRSARFVRYHVQTPQGLLGVFNVHPVSPRNGLSAARGEGFLRGLLRGRIGQREGIATLDANSLLRLKQAEAIAAEARRSPYPVLIAGDTNMPGLSWIFARTLGDYRDGFEVAGRGFGYTYPAGRAWMRIDRILGDDRLVFHRCEVLEQRASDHMAVLAEVTVRW